MIDDLLVSPLLRKGLCNPENEFTVNGKSKIFARLNRAEIGEFDALVLGLFLMAHYNQQLVIPDFGFYGRDAHVSLIREGRLVAGVNTLAELPPKLRQAVLLVKEKKAAGATAEDAETLATYMSGFARGQEGFNAYRDAAIVGRCRGNCSLQ